MTPSGQTICLCMIIKNEAHVIARCLASVRPIIDHWLIVDTGSTDGTQDIVRAALADVPGELHERPWRNFAHNRSEALELARPHADYTFIIDADDALEVAPDFEMPRLTAGSYTIQIVDSGTVYGRPQMVRNDQPWRYEGVLHEYLTCDGSPVASGLEDGINIRRNHDGARRKDPRTYHADAALLEEALATETSPFLISRYRFYLAQSYRDCGMKEKALENYLARADLGFWQEEVFVAMLGAARLKEELAHPEQDVLAAYQRATDAAPTRAEALHGASRFCRTKDRFEDGYQFALRGVSIGIPSDALFVEPWVYEFGLLDELGVNGYWAGHYRESLDATLKILAEGKCPADQRARVEANAEFCRQRLAEMDAAAAARKKPKIAVYTIALNEAANVARWCTSAADADYLVVADTGSTDETVALMRAAGVQVHNISVRPWRFDDARNASLALVPADADICVLLDMDAFLLPGWRAALEAAWTPGTTRIAYDYARNGTRFRQTKVHARFGYRWKRIVHEDLRCTDGKESYAGIDFLLMREVQDVAKDRSHYLPLLTLAHAEDPNDTQICFWLARELMYDNKNTQSVEKYILYLSLPTATWLDERSEAMRYLARVQPEQQAEWLLKAVLETPYRRELWLDLAEFHHSKLDWSNLFWACTNGIEKCRRTGSYLDDPNAWGYRLFDLGALACSHLGLIARAVEWGRKALDFIPEDRRLSNNLVWYRRQERSEKQGGSANDRTPALGPSRASLRFNLCHVSVGLDAAIFDDFINVLQRSLLELGYACSVKTNAVELDAVNIVIGSSLLASSEDLAFLAGVPYIAYQFEQLDRKSGSIPRFPKYLDFLKGAEKILEYSPSGIEFLRREGLGDKLIYLPPTFHKSLENLPPPQAPDIDVLFYGFHTPRRDKLFRELREKHVKAYHLDMIYGEDLAYYVNRAKIVLNIHAYDGLDRLETLRLSYLLANRRFIISEIGDHNPYGSGIVYATYDDLVEACLRYLGPKEAERSGIAALGHDEFRRTNFVADVQNAILSLNLPFGCQAAPVERDPAVA